MADILRERYPTLFYHKITDGEILGAMDALRLQYLGLAANIMDLCPDSRPRSLALTALEESLMRAIQSLAISDPGTLVDIREGY